MANEVIITADKIHKRKIRSKRTKIILSILFILLLVIFVVLYFVYSVNRFTISIDSNLRREKGIVIYEDLFERAEQRKLYATSISNMDNICMRAKADEFEKIHQDEKGGTHNGDNYIAYSFYIENQGSVPVNYFYTIVIDDVIKEVDEAVRVIVYLNDEKNVYAKLNGSTHEPEWECTPKTPLTTPFYDENTVVLQERENFNVGDIDKFTILIFLEGDDEDCIDTIIGGEIKMHMEIREEHLEGE